MNVSTVTRTVSVLVLATALACHAQTAAPAPEILANGNLLHTLLAAPVPNAPYTAREFHETEKTLPDGSHVRGHGGHGVARDSQGRVRVEVRTRAKDGSVKTLVFVNDPVAHTMTIWSEGGDSKPTATVTKLPPYQAPKPAAAKAPAVPDNRPQPVITKEDLGTVLLEGLPVQDVKTTTVVPPGRSGNDAPITKTEEVWTSPDMKLIIKQQWIDPRTGVRTQGLRQLVRAEPDGALFHPPANYELKDIAETMRELASKLETMANDEQSR